MDAAAVPVFDTFTDWDEVLFTATLVKVSDVGETLTFGTAVNEVPASDTVGDPPLVTTVNVAAFAPTG
jgi:hypothetical protein